MAIMHDPAMDQSRNTDAPNYTQKRGGEGMNNDDEDIVELGVIALLSLATICSFLFYAL